MKRKCLYVDGVDAWLTYGVFVAEQGYNNFVQWPSLKGIVTNDWFEEDGEEVDASRAVLDSRQVTMTFYATDETGYRNFLGAISSPTTHTIGAAEIGLTKTLRYVSQRSLSAPKDGIFKFLVQFMEDDPMSGYTYVGPLTSLVLASGYEIDGTSIASYGCVATIGTMEGMMRWPDVKKNYEQKNEFVAGARYGGNSHYAGRDVTLKFLLRAGTLEELWQNYHALLHDISTPGAHELTDTASGNEYLFYYKSCAVTKFYATGKIWLQFNVTIHIYNQ